MLKFFILANTSSVHPKHYFKENISESKDLQFCKWLTKEIGVAAIPPSSFYIPKDTKLVENYARFCFCKKDETITEAGKRLQKLLKYS